MAVKSKAVSLALAWGKWFGILLAAGFVAGAIFGSIGVGFALVTWYGYRVFVGQ